MKHGVAKTMEGETINNPSSSLYSDSSSKINSLSLTRLFQLRTTNLKKKNIGEKQRGIFRKVKGSPQ